MSRLRVADLVVEVDEETGRTWVAPVPSGPIVRVEGVGPLVLDLLAEEPTGLDEEELLVRLDRIVPDMPRDAAAALRPFLDSLVDAGVLERVSRDEEASA